MDTTIVNVALPSLARQFNVPTTSIDAVVVGYMVSLAMVIPVSGWLGDRIGTKRIFLLALALFSGALGRGEAAIPLTAVTFPAIPARLAWSIGLLPVYGLLIFWTVHTRRAAKERPGEEPAQPRVPTISADSDRTLAWPPHE